MKNKNKENKHSTIIDKDKIENIQAKDEFNEILDDYIKNNNKNKMEVSEFINYSKNIHNKNKNKIKFKIDDTFLRNFYYRTKKILSTFFGKY